MLQQNVSLSISYLFYFYIWYSDDDEDDETFTLLLRSIKKVKKEANDHFYILSILEHNCITILDDIKEKTAYEKYNFCIYFFADKPVEITKLAIDADLKLFVSHPLMNNFFKDSYTKLKTLAIVFPHWVLYFSRLYLFTQLDL